MRDGTAEPVSQDQILRRERGQGNIHFPCSADQEQDWQPYPFDPYSCYIIMCDRTVLAVFMNIEVGRYEVRVNILFTVVHALSSALEPA